MLEEVVYKVYHPLLGRIVDMYGYSFTSPSPLPRDRQASVQHFSAAPSSMTSSYIFAGEASL